MAPVLCRVWKASQQGGSLKLPANATMVSKINMPKGALREKQFARQVWGPGFGTEGRRSIGSKQACNFQSFLKESEVT